MSLGLLSQVSQTYFRFPLHAGVTLDCSHARVRSPGLGEQVDGVADMKGRATLATFATFVTFAILRDRH